VYYDAKRANDERPFKRFAKTRASERRTSMMVMRARTFLENKACRRWEKS